MDIWNFVKLFAVMMAALSLGRWFQAELVRNRETGRPWYAVYTSPPGLMILAAILLLPVAVWWFGGTGK